MPHRSSRRHHPRSVPALPPVAARSRFRSRRDRPPCFCTDGLAGVIVDGGRLGLAGLVEEIRALDSDDGATKIVRRLIARGTAQPDDMAAVVFRPGARARARGLPTFCQFAAPFPPPGFERWTGEDTDEQWERTIQTPGGAFADELMMATEDDYARITPIRRGPFALTVALVAGPDEPRGLGLGATPTGAVPAEQRPSTPEGTPSRMKIRPGAGTQSSSPTSRT